LGPRAMGVAVPAKIRQRGRLGKVGRITRDSPATGFWAWLGERGCRRVWTAAPGDGGHWSLASARWLLGGTRERDGEQQQVQERVEGTLVGECSRWDPGFTVAALIDAGGRHCERQGSRCVRGSWRGSILKASSENVPAP
jgi:hypothetical protein